MLVTEYDTELADERVLSLLSKPSVSAILGTATEPMTVKEISQYADVPLSTTYREVTRLADASLLDSRLRLDPKRGSHATEYVRTFDSIEVTVTDDGVAVQTIS